jgi:hypothetical protein
MLGRLWRVPSSCGARVSPVLAIALVVLVIRADAVPTHAHDGNEAGFFDAECPLLSGERIPPGVWPIVLPPLWCPDPPALAGGLLRLPIVALWSPTAGRPRSPPVSPRTPIR